MSEYYFPSQSRYVYFIQAGEKGPVKIGYGANPEERLRQLQTGNPENLYLRKVLNGFGFIEEAQLHRLLENFRIRNEWFSPAVLETVDDLETTFQKTFDKVKGIIFIHWLTSRIDALPDDEAIAECDRIIEFLEKAIKYYEAKIANDLQTKRISADLQARTAS